MFYDKASGKWSPEGLDLVEQGSALVWMTSTHLSYFAAVEVLAGCDAVPRKAFLYACSMVCMFISRFDHVTFCVNESGYVSIVCMLTMCS